MLSPRSIVLVLSWLSVIAATPTALLETRKSSSDPKISVSKFKMDCSSFGESALCTSSYSMKVSYDPGKNADASKGVKFSDVVCTGHALESHLGGYTDCSTATGMTVSAKVTSVHNVEIKMVYTGGVADGTWLDPDVADDKQHDAVDNKSFTITPSFTTT